MSKRITVRRMLKDRLRESNSSLRYMLAACAVLDWTESERQYCINLQKDIEQLEFLIEYLDNKDKDILDHLNK